MDNNNNSNYDPNNPGQNSQFGTQTPLNPAGANFNNPANSNPINNPLGTPVQSTPAVSTAPVPAPNPFGTPQTPQSQQNSNDLNSPGQSPQVQQPQQDPTAWWNADQNRETPPQPAPADLNSPGPGPQMQASVPQPTQVPNVSQPAVGNSEDDQFFEKLRREQAEGRTEGFGDSNTSSDQTQPQMTQAAESPSGPPPVTSPLPPAQESAPMPQQAPSMQNMTPPAAPPAPPPLTPEQNTVPPAVNSTPPAEQTPQQEPQANSAPVVDMNPAQAQPQPSSPAPVTETPAAAKIEEKAPDQAPKTEIKTEEKAQAEQASSEPKKDSIFDIAPKGADQKVKLPKKKLLRPTKKIMAVILLGLIGIPSAAFAYLTFGKGSISTKVAGIVASDSQVKDVTDKVSKLVALPIDEAPSQIANVSDTTKLSNNPFFAKAQNGDVVLIYQKNQEAVLYRPGINKIVSIGPLTNSSTKDVAGASTEALTSPMPSPSLSPTPTGVPSRNVSTPTPSPTVTVVPSPSPAPSE